MYSTVVISVCGIRLDELRPAISSAYLFLTAKMGRFVVSNELFWSIFSHPSSSIIRDNRVPPTSTPNASSFIVINWVDNDSDDDNNITLYGPPTKGPIFPTNRSRIELSSSIFEISHSLRPSLRLLNSEPRRPGHYFQFSRSILSSPFGLLRFPSWLLLRGKYDQL